MNQTNPYFSIDTLATRMQSKIAEHKEKIKQLQRSLRHLKRIGDKNVELESCINECAGINEDLLGKADQLEAFTNTNLTIEKMRD